MTFRGQADLKFSLSTASGGSATVDLSNYIDTIKEVGVEAKIVEVDGFGESLSRHFFTGTKTQSEIEVEGWYEDGASTPHAMLGQATCIGTERNYEIDFGASDVINGDVLIKSYMRMPKRGELTRWKAVLLPTGTFGTAT